MGLSLTNPAGPSLNKGQGVEIKGPTEKVPPDIARLTSYMKAKLFKDVFLIVSSILEFWSLFFVPFKGKYI